MWLTGLTLVGAAFAWALALFSGFSSNHVICWGARSAGSCEISSSPYWTASTVLWLAPVVIILVLGMWGIVSVLVPKTFPRFLVSVLMLAGFILLAVFVLSQAAKNAPL